MEYFICFFKDKSKTGPLFFVKSYKARSWFRKERIEYSFNQLEAHTFNGEDVDVSKVRDRIKSDYPNGSVMTFSTKDDAFGEIFSKNRFWVICKYGPNNEVCGYYAGVKDGKAIWVEDINKALFCMDEREEKETLNVLRQKGERVTYISVILDLVNDLLNPIFIILCESKSGKKEIKFFAREEGGRLRLVKTSFSAKKLTFSESIEMYEHLVVHNKNFNYAVIPNFKDNVNCKDLKSYIKEHPINRMVQTELKIDC